MDRDNKLLKQNALLQVLKAFVHGDVNLFNNYPELEEAMVWVYFNSNLPEFNRVECWGPLHEASSIGQENSDLKPADHPTKCASQCDCCFPPYSLIPYPQDLSDDAQPDPLGQTQQ